MEDHSSYNTNSGKEQPQTNSPEYRELAARNKLLETIIENSHEWIAVYSSDLTLLSINKAAAQAVGMTPDEMTGKSLYTLFPTAHGTQSEADLKKALSGEEVWNDTYFSPISRRWLQNYIIPLRDKTGNVYAALAVANDITALVKANEDQVRSQQHFEQLFMISPVAKTISLVSDGTILNVNPAWEQLFERKKEEVIGKIAAQIGIVVGENRNNNIQIVLEQGGSAHGFELPFTLANGKKIIAYTSVVTMNYEGTPCLLSAYIDITQRKRDEEKLRLAAEEYVRISQVLEQKNAALEKANKELESFNYIASHDLQEPLRKIRTFISMIHSNALDTAVNQMYMDKINHAALRMSQLIENVLEYARLSQTMWSFRSTDLNEVLANVKTDYELLITEKQATIQSDPLPVIDAIALQMHQLFSNLLSNSLKYSNQQPVINITSKIVTRKQVPQLADSTSDQPLVEIKFADNGIGFDPRYSEQIFKLFSRLHGRDEYGGTGVGLSIVKKVVDQHGGNITVESAEQGGTTFTIWLPLRQHAAAST